jgi:Flp pilus assembly protein TadG
MTRRGARAIELAVALPLFAALSAGTVDMGRFLHVSERLAAVAAEGARSGALADPDLGEDAVSVAIAAARDRWDSLSPWGGLTVDATLEGEAPNQRVVVRATAETSPVFGLVSIHPTTTTTVRTVRLRAQHRFP